jgi:hypothetical protein
MSREKTAVNPTGLDKPPTENYEGFCTGCLGGFFPDHAPVWVDGYPMHEGCAWKAKNKQEK